jgi:hypothetical protein
MSLPAETAEYTSDTYGGAYAATFTFARNLIAALPTFQQVILGVSSAEEAKLKVYKQETLAESDEHLPSDDEFEEGEPLPDLPVQPELEPRPYCVLIDDQRRRPRVAESMFASEGAILAAFEVPQPAEFRFDHDQDDAAVKRDKWRRFVDWRINLASAIEEEITQLTGQADATGNPYLNVIDAELIVPPSDPAEDVPGEPYIGFVFRLTWR